MTIQTGADCNAPVPPSPGDLQLIHYIAQRGSHLFPKLVLRHGEAFITVLSKSLAKVQVSDYPLDLPRLLTADEVTFAHDILGLHRAKFKQSASFLCKCRVRWSRSARAH